MDVNTQHLCFLESALKPALCPLHALNLSFQLLHIWLKTLQLFGTSLKKKKKNCEEKFSRSFLSKVHFVQTQSIWRNLRLSALLNVHVSTYKFSQPTTHKGSLLSHLVAVSGSPLPCGSSPREGRGAPSHSGPWCSALPSHAASAHRWAPLCAVTSLAPSQWPVHPAWPYAYPQSERTRITSDQCDIYF